MTKMSDLQTNIKLSTTNFLFPLGVLSEHVHGELPRISRSFHLYAGEKVMINNVQGDDYLFVMSGSVIFSASDSETHVLDEHKYAEQPFLLPNSTGQMAIEATKESLLYHVDRDKLDYLISGEQLLGRLAESDDTLHQRFRKISSITAFRQIPSHNLIEALKCLTSRNVSKGEEVVAMGKSNESFYVLLRGRAEVWIVDPLDPLEGKQCMVRKIGPGDSFGESSLVTGKAMDATVIMLEDGEVLVLGGDDFRNLVIKPLIAEVDLEVAKSMIDAHDPVLDVRMEGEYEEGVLPGAIMIPLQLLPERVNELDKAKCYVIYCRSGIRSAVAALLLEQRGIQAVSMRGGIKAWKKIYGKLPVSASQPMA